MAESVMRQMVRERGWADRVRVDSAATSTEEIGNPVHPGTQRKLREKGVAPAEHRAVQMTRADYDRYELLVGMDSANLRNMLRILGGDPQGKVLRLLDFTAQPRDIADPWYTGDFEATYRDVRAGCEALLEQLACE